MGLATSTVHRISHFERELEKLELEEALLQASKRLSYNELLQRLSCVASATSTPSRRSMQEGAAAGRTRRRRIVGYTTTAMTGLTFLLVLDAAPKFHSKNRKHYPGDVRVRIALKILAVALCAQLVTLCLRTWSNWMDRRNERSLESMAARRKELLEDLKDR